MSKSKPEFNPDQPFEVVQGVKPEFDPNAPFTTAEAQAVPEGSDLEDIARGIGQGATVGFGDEIAGAVEATGDVLFKDSKLADWYQQYRKHQQESEAANKASQDRSPWLYGAGDVAGSVGAGILTGGAGLAAGAGNVGLKSALMTGAKLGALEGLGRSEHNIEQPLGLGKDVASSAAVGGVVSGGFNLMKRLGSFGVDKVDDILGDSPTMAQTKLAFNEGKAGRLLNQGDEATNRIAGEQLTAIKHFSKNFADHDTMLGKELNALRATASKAGMKMEFDAEAKEIATVFKEALEAGSIPLAKSTRNRVGIQLEKLGNGSLNPEEAFSLHQEIRDIFGKSDAHEGLLYKLDTAVKNALYKIPKYKEAETVWKKYRSATIENIMNGDVPVELRDRLFSDVSNGREKLAQATDRFLTNVRMPGAPQNKTGKRGLHQLIAGLQDLEVTNPGKLPKGYSQRIGSELKTAGDHFALSGHALGYEPQTGMKGILTGELLKGGAPTWTGRGLQLANTAGNVTRKVKEVIGGGSITSPMVKLSKDLYGAPEESLRFVSDKLKSSNSEALARLGETLERGLNDKNASMTNAALFTLMQNPQARSLFHSDEKE